MSSIVNASKASHYLLQLFIISIFVYSILSLHYICLITLVQMTLQIQIIQC